MDNDSINKIFGISESFKLPDVLMADLLNADKRTELFDKFSNEDLSKDLFTNYFQEQHSNRESMMQDFTPSELAEVLVKSVGSFSMQVTHIPTLWKYMKSQNAVNLML